MSLVARGPRFWHRLVPSGILAQIGSSFFFRAWGRLPLGSVLLACLKQPADSSYFFGALKLVGQPGSLAADEGWCLLKRWFEWQTSRALLLLET